MVFSCSSVSLVLLTPKGSPGVLVHCGCRDLVLVSSQSFSSVISLLVKICLSKFPFNFEDKLWVLVRPVLGVSLLVLFSMILIVARDGTLMGWESSMRAGRPVGLCRPKRKVGRGFCMPQ